jgi:hypothetical protein
MDKNFSKLCTPAKIYFCIAVIASMIALFRGITFIAVFVKLLFAFFWSYILGWLCKKGYASISWFLVLFPYIVILLAALQIANINQHRGIFRSVGLQGAYGEEAFTNKETMPMSKETMPMSKETMPMSKPTKEKKM